MSVFLLFLRKGKPPEEWSRIFKKKCSVLNSINAELERHMISKGVLFALLVFFFLSSNVSGVFWWMRFFFGEPLEITSCLFTF